MCSCGAQLLYCIILREGGGGRGCKKEKKIKGEIIMFHVTLFIVASLFFSLNADDGIGSFDRNNIKLYKNLKIQSNLID